MRADISGWTTRLSTEQIARHRASGAWRDVTLAECAQRSVQHAPQRVAVVDGVHTLTYAELFARARKLAAGFAALGLEPGEVIGFQLPNWWEAMAINLAACMHGLVVNPIVPIYRDAEVRTILEDSRAKVLFIPRGFRNFDYLSMVQRLRPSLPALRKIVIVRGEASGCLAFDELVSSHAPAPAALSRTDPNAVKLVLYTSGTTGRAKGVLHSHNTIMSEIDAVIAFWGIHDHDVVLMPSPVTHITGYLYALEIVFCAGVKVVLMERWNAAAAAELIARHGVSFSVGATPFLKELVAEVEARALALPSLRLFMSGGAPVPPEVIERANRVLPDCMTFRVYGASEAPTITLGIRSRSEAHLGAHTDGKIVNNDVRLLDVHTGAELRDGEGEICVRGPEVMLGYTAWDQTLESFDSEGYFHTGDLGYLVEGDYLCVSGRKKDLIIRGGENLSPKEIEDALHLHPAIKEVAIVAMPHERLGEGVCAFVIPGSGERIDVTTLAAFLEAAGLARQKFPERVELVDDLPRTASGKVQKNLLRARVTQLIAQERSAQASSTA